MHQKTANYIIAITKLRQTMTYRITVNVMSFYMQTCAYYRNVTTLILAFVSQQD